MIKVLAIGYGRQLFKAGNRERQRMEACALETNGYHIVVFTRQADGLKRVEAKNGLVIHPTGGRTKIGMIAKAFWIGWQLVKTDRENFVVTTQDSFVAGLVGFLIARLGKLPLNIQEHGGEYNGPYWREVNWRHNFLYKLGRFLLKQATSVRVVSQRSKDTLLNFGLKSNQIFYLPVRSDVAISHSQIVHLNHSGKVVVLSLARFVPQKNLALLISAFAEFAPKYPEASLRLVGEGSLGKDLEAQVQKLGIGDQVEFYPWSQNPAEHFQVSDIYALSSDWEGWGRVLVEAMAYGLPIVTTDVGCAGEVVRDNVHGFVVPVRDKKLFTNRLEKLLSDATLRGQFSASGKRDVASVQISESEYAKRWAKILVDTHQIFHSHSY